MREYHSVEAYRANGWGDQSENFFAFMQSIDKTCRRWANVSIFDLPDRDFASAFEDGNDPREIAQEILMEEGFDI